jgi:2-oxoisovalerate dehydrogenase E1 component
MSSRVINISTDSIIKKALKIRAFEQVLLENFYKLEARGTIHTSIGQELLPVVLSETVTPEDFIFGTHRSHGIYLSVSNDFKGLLSEILGVENATSLGLGGSQHLNHNNLYTNGIQAGMAPIATGTAHAQLKSEGISICFIGDGTFGQGVLYESFNQASILCVPTLFVIEDNEIAQSTLTKNVIAGSITKKIEAFNIDTFETSTADLNELLSVTSAAVSKVRGMRKPAALIVAQNRLSPHSKGDDNRNKEELQKLYENDLLYKFVNSEIIYSKYFENCKKEFMALIDSVKTQKPAENVHKDYGLNLNFDCKQNESIKPNTIRQLTHDSLDYLMSQSKNNFMLGQDIEYSQPGTSKPYPGAFGITKDLSEKYPDQIRNSAISESAMVGFGIGRALAGKSTVIEIMFGDFTTLIVDQIKQQASKIVGMYGARKNLALLIRTPMGGRKGYGPTHSQNLETMFLSIPNVIVYSQNIFFSKEHYSCLLTAGLPTLAIENKDLYSEDPNVNTDPFYQVIKMEQWVTHIKNNFNEKRILVITYGYAASLCIKAALEMSRDSEIFFDILVLTIISPLVLDKVKSTIEDYDKVVLVEECDPRTGLAGSVIDEFDRLGIKKILKCLGGNGIIGASMRSESEALISIQKIKNVIGSV